MNQSRESGTRSAGMPVVDALRVLADVRSDDQVVITHQGASRVWPKIAQSDLDFHYNPSTMGGAIPLALGMALANPSREFLVITGDGALLMSLGSLVSVMSAGVRNLSVFVLDNGRYEVTGGQKTPACDGGLDFCDVARAIGFASVTRLSCLEKLRRETKSFLEAPGPRFASLVVGPVDAEYLQSSAIPLTEQMDRLLLALM